MYDRNEAEEPDGREHQFDDTTYQQRVVIQEKRGRG